jgi:hypothetical protein
MRTLVLLSLVLSFTGIASATTDWKGPLNGGVDQDWFNAANWSLGVPDVALQATQGGIRTYSGGSYANSLTVCPVINSGNATTKEIRIGGAGNSADMSYMVMNGGTLATQNFLMIGPDSGSIRSGTLYVHGGTITLGGAADGIRTSGHLFVGHGTGTTAGIVGKLFMNAGTIDAGADFAIGKNNSQGEVYLSGTATIYANTLKMRPDSASASAYMDISGLAKVIINGDVRTTVQAYINSGWITAEAGDGTVYNVFDSVNNKTIISAIPEPATMTLLGLGILGLIRRK